MSCPGQHKSPKTLFNAQLILEVQCSTAWYTGEDTGHSWLHIRLQRDSNMSSEGAGQKEFTKVKMHRCRRTASRESDKDRHQRGPH